MEDAIGGCVTLLGDQGANLGRLAVLEAGFPPEVPAVTINRMCGSSQQAAHFAAQAVLAGDMELVLAGGTEMMSHQPLGSDWPKEWPEDFPYKLVHQGVSAELMAEKWGLSRDELDDFACQSHFKAMKAIQAGNFESQILPITCPDGRVVTTDEGVRMPPNREKMSALKPVFKPDGVVTAGNASQISDGAAALLVASSRAVDRYQLKPLVRLIARTAVGSTERSKGDVLFYLNLFSQFSFFSHLDKSDTPDTGSGYSDGTLTIEKKRIRQEQAAF